jgi:hypothetical protein
MTAPAGTAYCTVSLSSPAEHKGPESHILTAIKLLISDNYLPGGEQSQRSKLPPLLLMLVSQVLPFLLTRFVTMARMAG